MQTVRALEESWFDAANFPGVKLQNVAVLDRVKGYLREMDEAAERYGRIAIEAIDTASRPPASLPAPNVTPRK